MTHADIEDSTPTSLTKLNKKIFSEADYNNFFLELLNRSSMIPKHTAEDFDRIHSNLRTELKFQPSKNELRETFDRLNKTKTISLTPVFKRWLIKKAMRSDSGVLVVTVVTKPGANMKFSCTYRCSFCPSEYDKEGNPTQPKSYISSEPAMRRALKSEFDIEGQVRDRLNSYLYTGNIKNDQNKKKIEVILSGGTWDVMPFDYRQQVINELFYAFNTFNDPIDSKRSILSIDEEISINQTATYGVIGLSIETRPDHITKRSVKQYLKWGITRVQIGVQHFSDSILRKINRDCYLNDTINAIRILKGVGLKIVIHLMPDLPGSSPVLDRWMFAKALNDPALQVDDMKIYPCAVIKSHDPKYVVVSDISKWYDNGEYVPYSETNLEDLINVLIEFKKKMNRWIRIERLIRDIPAHSMTAGYGKVSNLRQIIEERMKKTGEKCICIRCMEIRNREYDSYRLSVREYESSDGKEYFIGIDVENKLYHYDWIKYLILYWIFYIFSLGKKKLFYEGSDSHYTGTLGFCRLRIDPDPGFDIVPEINNCGLIRELHVYGQAVCVGEESVSTQHKGFGSILMKTAETIILQNGLNKSAVIAGVGAREYYRAKHNYKLEGTYMTKLL